MGGLLNIYKSMSVHARALVCVRVCVGGGKINKLTKQDFELQCTDGGLQAGLVISEVEE